mmetsp:Transcript_17648/g.12578  ORF Transcript_17648/g.12578 Transcript_17648/m.12578 type:complete len:179 (+) Transcript_17648:112-648(+)
MAYFFLLMLISLIYLGASPTITNCSIPYRPWYQLSASFYLLAFIATLLVGFRLQKSPPGEETIVIRKVILTFSYHGYWWAYLVLCSVEVVHLWLSCWGALLYFTKDLEAFSVCYDEVPMLINFLLILVVIGFTYFVRFIFIVLQFGFGAKIFKFLKARSSWMRAFEQELKLRLPIFNF